ncbi:MAG: hypothetical protein AB8B55_09195 [Mariniblastus sp.]
MNTASFSGELGFLFDLSDPLNGDFRDSSFDEQLGISLKIQLQLESVKDSQIIDV